MAAAVPLALVTFTETPEHKFDIAHLPSLSTTTSTHHPSAADPGHSVKMTWTRLTARHRATR
ncbi:hypothetical protein WOLCODRAFT_24471 [Wolfiporia cocos MD-104 SS10]|uniref:Uncharacterized protein n=1 Tax=Wolfiporia cocos (strain MD-104) TaxID=742152 RepID=A0A2H3JFV0_WOLCO|nr:hypothetical protein WOLCODRAFT_24471 [Wolfiporia cocos MD-104 SS10]